MHRLRPRLSGGRAGVGNFPLFHPPGLISSGAQSYRQLCGARIIVTYLTNILVNVLTALIKFRLQRQLGFGVKEAVASVLALIPRSA